MNRGSTRRRDLTPLEQLTGELDLHDLLFDKDTKTAFEAWGKKVKPLIAELTEVADRVGKAKDIERLHSEAEKASGAAGQALADAKDEALKITTAATTAATLKASSMEAKEDRQDEEYKAALAALANDQSAFNTRRKASDKALSDVGAAQDERETGLVARKDDLDDREADIRPREEAAEALRALYEGKLAAHRAFVDEQA